MRDRSLSGLDDRDVADVMAELTRFEGALCGARVLITGATGWFGTWLLDMLVALDRSRGLGLRIVAVSRSPKAFAAKHPALYRASQIEWIAADVRRPLAIDGTLTHVIHAATDASARLNVEDPGGMHDTIVMGTRNVLALAAAHAGIRVLLVSSGAVYGIQPSELTALSESHVVDADHRDTANAYAEGKREAERLAVEWQESGHGDVVIARCFAFVGPHMPFDEHFAIGNFIRDALDREAIVIRGDGSPMRSYLYSGDLVVWLLAMLVNGRSGRAYNVGSDEAVSIAALARRCASVVEQPVQVVVERQPGDARNYVPAVDRARRELGLAVRVPLDAAIARTASWRMRRGEAERLSCR